MKIKQAFAKILIGLVVFFAIQNLIGGFELSKSISYVLVFLALFLATEWLTVRIRIFFLIPPLLPMLILIHTLLLFALFYLGDSVIAGVSVTKLHPGFILFLGKPKVLQTLGEFGTIGVVSLCMGIVYQVINWLSSEK